MYPIDIPTGMSQTDPLDDAQLLYERALAHLGDYNRMSGADEGLWRIVSGREGGAFTCTLVLDRDRLRALKPIISDVANNLVHALDHVAAAAYQATSSDRPRRLYFPIAPDDETYAGKQKALEKLLDRKWLDLFAAVRERHKPSQGYLWLLKQISNSAKHWQLIAGGAGAAAVAWNIPGAPRQTIVEIPKDYFAANDAFVFWRQVAALPGLPIQILTQHRFENLDDSDASVDSVFSTCARFVDNIIAESRKLLA